MTVAEKIVRAKEDYTAVHEAGKKAEYDTFWDAYQNKGTPHMHHYKFAGVKWDDNTFKPKYDIKPRYGSTYVFALSKITDIVASLSEKGVTLDTSEASDMRYFCYSMESKTFPVMDFSGITDAALTTQIYIFGSAKKLETIEKIVLKDGLTYTRWFDSCEKLRDVTFEGVIANDVDLHWSPLSRASIENIIGCLSDTAEGKTLTLSFTAAESAFPSSDDYAHWTAIVAAKPNWSILLV